MTDQELDALVAEKVMGWDMTMDDGATAPPYSSDIGAAWEVVEKMLAMKDQEPMWVYPTFQSQFYGAHAEEMTAPEAARHICLAALRAVGVKA